jgi:hypothetical protein
MDWLTENWYVAWGIFCASAIVLVAIYCRRNPEASGARAFFWLFPRLDPNHDFLKEVTPLALVLWSIGILVVLAAIIFIPGFA